MIGIIDYGAGNLYSVRKALNALSLPSCIVDEPARMEDISHLILPGVGSFGSAMESLLQRGLIAPLNEWQRCRRPVLGICLGLQLMTLGSEESPEVPGLGWLDCATVALQTGKRPHMGWSGLRRVSQEASECLEIADGQSVYFVHSYAVITEEAAAICDHGEAFAAALGKDNCWGLQFHPEKSGRPGLEILRSWREKCR